MRIFLLATLFLSAARGAGVQSPDAAHTFAYHRIIEHELRRVPGGLAASVTFSNIDYADRTEARRDERVDFLLPGVRLDAKSGLYFTPEGRPFAILKKTFFGVEIRLLPNARIDLANRSGTVRLALSVGDAPCPGLQWLESSQASFLPNPFGWP